MPTVLIRGQVTATGTPFELKGFTSQPVTGVFVEESILGRETEVPISGLGEETEPPPPVLSARILGLPFSAQELSTVTTLSAELIDDAVPPNVVDLYDPADWTWAVVSGGGSFGGPNGDQLTLPAAPATVVIRATHNAEQVPGSAEISVVATVTFAPDFFNLTTQVIAGQQTSSLRSRVLNSDGSVAEQINTNWTYSIVSGPGVISGPVGNQVLVPNAGAVGQSITVRATYTGGLNVVPIFQDRTTSVIAQPQPGDFPNNEPVGFTPIIAMNGSSLSHAGLTPQGPWTDPGRVSVVVDTASKYGNAIEKRFFVDDGGAWHGLLRGNIGAWNELYMRFIFMMSSNYQYWNGKSGKLIYYDAAGSNLDFILGNENLYWIDGGSGQGQYEAQCYPQLRISRGVYHTLEIHQTASLTPNSGSLRFWFDGVECNNFLRLGQGEFTDLKNRTWAVTAGETDKRIGRVVEFPWFWGGSGFNKSVDDFVRFSEMYIAGRN